MTKYYCKIQWNANEVSECVYDLESRSIEDFVQKLYDNKFFVQISYWPLEQETVVTSEAVFLKRKEELVQQIEHLKMESKSASR